MATKKKSGASKQAPPENSPVRGAKPESSDAKPAAHDVVGRLRITIGTPDAVPWLKVTSKKSGYSVFLPLPIRMIQQIPDTEGGGCIVRGAHGDESTTRESVLEILDLLGGYPLRSASVWALAK